MRYAARSCSFLLTFLAVTALLSSTALAKGFGPPEYPVGVGPAFAVTADLRGMNRQDIIVSNGDVNNGVGAGTTISVLLSNGDGTYQPAVPYTVGKTPIGIAVADFNGDGHYDLAVANANAGGATGTVTILLGRGDGTFTTGATINVGANPVGPIAADINGDGKMDLVVTNSDLFGADNCASSSVSILLGNGNGTFKPASPATVQAGACPLDAALVDLNGDGKLDLVVVNNGGMKSTTTSNVSVLLGNGNGTFQKAVNYAVGSRPSFVAVSDYNGDGKLDLAVANQGAKNSGTNGGISLLLGNGNGTFQAASFIPGITRADNVVAGDFNSDGHIDLAFLGKNNGSGNVSIIFGNGNGTFQSPPTALGVPGVNIGLVAADLNGDGAVDLAVPVDNSPNPGEVAVLLGDGVGDFPNTPITYFFNGSSPQALTPGFFNNDGYTDIAVALTNFQTCCPTSASYDILTGSGHGTFHQLPAVALPFGNATGIVEGFFLNTSPHEQLVILQNGGGGNSGYSYLQSNNDGTFQNPVNTTLGTTNPSSGCFPFQVATADLNHDGTDDLLIGGCNAAVSTLTGNGNGTFGPPNSLSQQAGVGIASVMGQIAVGALGGTGSTAASPSDIVAVVPDASNTNINAYVYLDQGGGTYGSPLVYQIGSSTNCGTFCAMGAATGNFVETTNPNFQDIAVTNVVNNTVTILKNNANGTFTPGTPIVVGTAPDYISVADFNGDGHLDLAVANCGTCGTNSNNNGSGSTISILYGNGDGTFQNPTPATTYVAGTGSVQVAVAEFNGDNARDLVVANSLGGNVTVLVNNGGTGMSLIPSPASPSTVGQNVTFTSGVFGSVLSATATGTVTFMDGATTLGTPSVGANSFAGVQTASLTAGVHSITAKYSGDGNYNPNSRMISFTVNKGASSTSLNATPNPAFVGQTVTLTAVVSGGGPAPSDGSMVTFMNGVSPIGSAALSGGSASITFAFGTVATDSLTAVYAGDANYNGSTSPVVNEVVQLAPTTTTVASGTNPSVAGNSVTFTATVTTPFGKPAGMVTFSATGPAVVTSSSGSLNISGMASNSLLFTLPGTYQVTASYGGDTDHAASASAPLTQIVNCATCTGTTTTISSVVVTPADAGERPGILELRQTATVTVTVMATSGAAAPTGSVQLQDNGVNLGSPQPLTPGPATSSTATFTVTGLPLGAHNLVAIYPGVQTGTPPLFGGSLSAAQAEQRTPKPHGGAH